MEKYYSINEELAARAKSMMSFSNYVQGSKTAEYRGYVDRAYEIAEEAVKVRPSEEKRIYFLVNRYAKKLADNMNKESAIGTRCPSIMIAGGSNFPVRKKEKQVAAWERNHQEYIEIQKILYKINSIKYGTDVIKSGDPAAIEKLQAKLEDAIALQERMKAANKALRKKDVEEGNEELSLLGYTDMQIEKLREKDYCGRIGFPSYKLQNNNAEIHRLKKRIESIKAVKESGNSEEEFDGFKLVKDTEDMRIRFIFDDKPDAQVRDVLKGNGFRWSPKNAAWQRQLNTNGEWAAKRVIEALV